MYIHVHVRTCVYILVCVLYCTVLIRDYTYVLAVTFELGNMYIHMYPILVYRVFLTGVCEMG